ncbi:MAG: DUF1292 domain-containing protein [Oscillospiraceae bacterium]|nr:DUF1292 domain-containing protein [Oscillospiraceae bacterium]
MNDDFGNDFVTISDDDGNEFELEHLDTLEIDGVFYMAFLPADMDEDDENFGLIILKKADNNGEETLTTLDDEEELSIVFEKFVELFSDEEQKTDI